ncbi:uncharacterized protein [Amphiura filiformis]|uniref:uncharacterized protein n=1 Tax=Amphiura filiformis TaxID=82378 RepID=UPI003B22756A
MDPDLDNQSVDSCGDILAADVKANALDLTMETGEEQKSEDATGVVLDEGTCVLVLPVNQPGDATTGNMGSMGIKCEGEGGHLIGTLQDGTPVSIAGALNDVTTGSIGSIVAGTSSMPTIHSVGDDTIEQQLAAAKAVAKLHASLASLTGVEGGGREVEQSVGETSHETYMMESTSKSGNFDPVTQSWFTSKHTKDNLSEQGHKWKQGMWSKEEVDILESNIEEYLKLHSIADANEVIFEMNKEERKDFYRFIAKDLQRPLFAVYRRVIRMYDQKNHVGKYSKEDIEKLKQLREKHGNDWALIGTEMGRSASSVKDKFRLLKERCHQGKWDQDEENILATAVYDLSNAEPGESITTGISWAQVAERVGTRTEKQCRAKWLNYLNWKEQGGSEWSKEDDNKLIERIEASEVEEERLLNWEELAKDWSSVRSPQWLRSKWWNLKRNVIGNESLSLQATLECLKTFPKRPHIRTLRQHHQPQRIKLARVELPALADVRGATATLTVRVPIQIEQSGRFHISHRKSKVLQLLLLSEYQSRLNSQVGFTSATENQVSQGRVACIADVRGATATLTVRVPIQIEQSGSSATVTLDGSDADQVSASNMDNIQELEIFQTSGGSPNTYFIATPLQKNLSTTQSVSNSLLANSRAGTSSSSNQLIFSAMRAEPIQSNDNVTVQLNQSQHGYSIITSKSQPSSTCSSSHLDHSNIAPPITTADLSTDTSLSVPSSQQDDITNDSTHLATEISQSDSNEDQTMNSQSQLIGTDAVLSQQDVGSSDLTEVSSEPETTLVIVSSAPSSDLVQSSGSVEDSQLGGVFQLGGPMLHSQPDNSDLMASPVDSDSCKDKLVDSPPDHHNHDSVDS